MRTYACHPRLGAKRVGRVSGSISRPQTAFALLLTLLPAVGGCATVASGSKNGRTESDADDSVPDDSGEIDSGSLDRDGDGYRNDEDCAPDDADAHPGGTEVCGNRVDDDCDGTSNDCRLTGDTTRAEADAQFTGPEREAGDDTIVGISDMDGDGVRDLAFGEDGNYLDSTPGRGLGVYIARGGVSGASELVDAWAVLVGEGRSHLDGAGLASYADGVDVATLLVGAPGDIDGDGKGDLLTSADAEDVEQAYLIYGGAREAGAYVLGASDATFTGSVEDVSFGERCFRVGDVSGDGAPDTLVGTRAAAISYYGTPRYELFYGQGL